MPFTNGNHWVATRGTRVLHIIGTLHFDDARMDDVVDRLEPIIEKSDAVLFEINSADLKATPRNLANNMDLLIIAQGPTLLELLPEKDWKTLSRLTVSHGLPPWMATKMKPWFLSTMLANPVCMGKLKDMQRGLDRRITEVSQNHGIPEISLENPLYVMRLMDSYPLAEQVWGLQVSLPLLDQTEDTYTTMVNGYFDEDVVRVLTVMEYVFRQSVSLTEQEYNAAFNEPLKALIDRRNRNWLPIILKQEGDLVVVAVGAGHLNGKNGLLNLLQESGFELQQAPF